MISSSALRRTQITASHLKQPARNLSILSDAPTMSSDSSQRKLKILMIHGYTQNGPLFHAKTRALEKNLDKAFPPAPKPGYLPSFPGGVELVYPTAPLKLSVNNIPGYDVDGAKGDNEEPEAYAWWRRKGDGEPFRYEGLEQGFERIASVIKEQGPFDGAIGFSQGGAAAGMLASLLEAGRREAFEKQQPNGGIRYPESFESDTGYVTDVIQEPLKFAVSYSGFGAPNELYSAFYEPKIKTPMLHFIGSVDTVVEESRSLRLVDACVTGRGVEGGVARLVYHPGGHFLPSSQKQYVAALVAFIREVVGGPPEDSLENKKEDKAEDMDMPF
ncbi:dihydrofolate reductase, partial [Aureobasidium melanogenum]